MAKKRRNGSGVNIIRRKGPNGYEYGYQFKDEAGKWRDRRIPRGVRIRNEDDAHDWATNHLAAQKVATAEPVVPSSLGALLDQWLNQREETEAVRTSTRRGNEQHVRQHIRPALGRLPMKAVTPDQIGKFIAALKKKPAPRPPHKPLAANTVRNCYRTLVKALRYAVDCGYLTNNPAMADSVRDLIPESDTRSEVDADMSGVHVLIPFEHAVRLATAKIDQGIPEHRSLRYLTALTTGLREGELSGLQWSDIVRVAAVPHICVRRQVSGSGEVGEPKTKHSKRRIPMHPELLRRLLLWNRSGWVRLVGRSPRPHDHVFPGAGGTYTRPRSAQLLRDDLDLRLGLPNKTPDGSALDFHSFRRTFSTMLSELGCPSELGDRAMGHSPKSTRARAYNGKVLETLAPWIAKFDIPSPVPSRPDLAGVAMTIREFCDRWRHAPVEELEPLAHLRQGLRQRAAREARKCWSHLRDLNSRPAVYETDQAEKGLQGFSVPGDHDPTSVPLPGEETPGAGEVGMRCAASDLRQAYGRPAANDRPAEGVQPEAAQELAQSAGKLEGPCPHGDVEDAPGEPPDGEDEAPPSGTRWAVPETAEAIADEVASAVRELGHERAAALLVWIRGDAEKAG